MAHLEDTVKVEIAEFPGPQGPPPWQRWGFLAAALGIVTLVLGLAVVLSQKSREPRAPRPVIDATTTSGGMVPGPSVDLVTGQPVDPVTAPFRVEFYGTELYFNSRESFEAFRRDPLAYVNLKMKVDVKLNEGEASPETAVFPSPAEDEEEGVEEGSAMGAPSDQDLSLSPTPGPEGTPPPGPPEPENEIDGWSDAREPPPSIEQPVRAPAPAGQNAAGAPPAGLPADDVILSDTVETPSEAVHGDPDVILDSDFQNPPAHPQRGRPGPAGPATPLPR